MPDPTVPELLLAALLGNDAPFFVATLPQGVYLIDKKTGLPTTTNPLIPSSRVKPTDHFTIQQDPNSKITYLLNTTTGDKEEISLPKSGLTSSDIQLIQTIDLEDGSKRVVYRFGTETETFTVPPGKEPFKLGQIQERDGLKFLEVAKDQFQMLPQKYQTGVVEQSGRFFIQQPNGQLQQLPTEYEAGLKNIQGRSFIQQPDGSLSPLAPSFEAGVVSRSGREFLQQPSGSLSELSTRTPNAVMDQIISEAIINGDMDKALAFSDFRDRPTDQEALAYAFQFARSPADQLLVSALARGDQVVEQRPSTPTRIGPQPDFLINAFNKFQGRMGAGRPPTGEEAQFYLDLPRRREEQTRKLEEQKLEQERLRTESMNASAQTAWEKAFQAGIATARGYGESLGIKPPTGPKTPTTVEPGMSETATFGGLPISKGAASAFSNAFSFPLSAKESQEADMLAKANAPLGTYPGDQPPSWFQEEPRRMAGGGIAFGPTNVIIGDEGPEAVIPLTPPKEENLPIDLRYLQQGRHIPPSRGNLFRAAGLTIPSAQALQNLTPESLASFRDLGALSGIPRESFEQELRLGSPAGGRVRSPLFLPFLFRR